VDRRIVAAILALVCVIGAIIQMRYWPTALVGYGDSISAAGLALTVIGFVLTYLEIRDARNEASVFGLKTCTELQLSVILCGKRFPVRAVGETVCEDANPKY